MVIVKTREDDHDDNHDHHSKDGDDQDIDSDYRQIDLYKRWFWSDKLYQLTFTKKCSEKHMFAWSCWWFATNNDNDEDYKDLGDDDGLVTVGVDEETAAVVLSARLRNAAVDVETYEY